MLSWLSEGHGSIDGIEDITPCPTGGWTITLWRGIEQPSYTAPTLHEALSAAVLAVADERNQAMSEHECYRAQIQTYRRRLEGLRPSDGESATLALPRGANQ